MAPEMREPRIWALIVGVLLGCLLSEIWEHHYKIVKRPMAPVMRSLE